MELGDNIVMQKFSLRCFGRASNGIMSTMMMMMTCTPLADPQVSSMKTIKCNAPKYRITSIIFNSSNVPVTVTPSSMLSGRRQRTMVADAQFIYS